MTTEPICRACWLATLPDAERERVAAEAITSCVHLCVSHSADGPCTMCRCREFVAEVGK